MTKHGRFGCKLPNYVFTQLRCKNSGKRIGDKWIRGYGDMSKETDRSYGDRWICGWGERIEVRCSASRNNRGSRRILFDLFQYPVYLVLEF
jgi:hypothetical protein